MTVDLTVDTALIRQAADVLDDASSVLTPAGAGRAELPADRRQSGQFGVGPRGGRCRHSTGAPGLRRPPGSLAALIADAAGKLRGRGGCLRRGRICGHCPAAMSTRTTTPQSVAGAAIRQAALAMGLPDPMADRRRAARRRCRCPARVVHHRGPDPGLAVAGSRPDRRRHCRCWRPVGRAPAPQARDRSAASRPVWPAGTSSVPQVDAADAAAHPAPVPGCWPTTRCADAERPRCSALVGRPARICSRWARSATGAGGGRHHRRHSAIGWLIC